MIKVERKKSKMKKLYHLKFIILFFLLLSDNVLAESKLNKIKDKIKTGEDKLIGKIWGNEDCSQYSTKTLAGLADYKRCKSGLKKTEKNNIFKSLKWKSKKNKEFDPNKPCDEYSSKTFTGLAAKIKCKRGKKN